jgi:hypothetical protein
VDKAADVRIGVIAGSILAGTAGFVLLRLTTRVPEPNRL